MKTFNSLSPIQRTLTTMGQTLNYSEIFIILLWFLYGSQSWAMELPKSISSIDILQKIIPLVENQTSVTVNQNIIKEKCPLLYASFPISPNCSLENPSRILCITAVQFSSYLCSMPNAIDPAVMGTDMGPGSACQTLEDSQLASKLMNFSPDLFRNFVSSTAASNLTGAVTYNCNEMCNTSTPYCQIIVLSLKTLVKMKEDQETSQIAKQKDLNLNADTTTTSVQDVQTTIHNATPHTKGSRNGKVHGTKHATSFADKVTTTPSTRDATISAFTTHKEENPIHVPKMMGGATKKSKLQTDPVKKILIKNEPTDTQVKIEDNSNDGKYSPEDDVFGSENIDEQVVTRPSIQAESHKNDADRYFDEPEDTHFLFYFISFASLSVCGYVAYIKRKRIIALIIEGRGQPSSSRRRSGSSRGRSGSYRKLVNNLEEVITSSQSVKNSNIIY